MRGLGGSGEGALVLKIRTGDSRHTAAHLPGRTGTQFVGAWTLHPGCPRLHAQHHIQTIRDSR